MIHTRIAIKTWEDSKPHERLLWLLDISWCTLDELLQLVNHLSDPSEVSTCRVPGSARQCPVPGSARLLHIIGQLFWRGHLRPCRAVSGRARHHMASPCRVVSLCPAFPASNLPRTLEVHALKTALSIHSKP